MGEEWEYKKENCMELHRQWKPSRVDRSVILSLKEKVVTETWKIQKTKQENKKTPNRETTKKDWTVLVPHHPTPLDLETQPTWKSDGTGR